MASNKKLLLSHSFWGSEIQAQLSLTQGLSQAALKVEPGAVVILGLYWEKIHFRSNMAVDRIRFLVTVGVRASPLFWLLAGDFPMFLLHGPYCGQPTTWQLASIRESQTEARLVTQSQKWCPITFAMFCSLEWFFYNLKQL